MSLLAAWFWPKVSDRKNAQFAINEAFCVAIALAVIAAVFATIQVMQSSEDGFDAEPFVSIVVFSAIAFGIHRRSRIAAISGLVLYLVGCGYAWVRFGPNFGVIPVLVALAMVHGVRGTFAFQKLPPRPEGLPSLAQSFGALQHNPVETEKVVGKGEEGNSAGV
jgi:hypothetical protein